MIESNITLREVDIDPVYLVPIYIEEADKRPILDETGNTILDETGARIFDD